MNVGFLFSLPSGLAEFDGVKKLLADAAAFVTEEGEGGVIDVPSLFCGCDPEGQPLGSGGGTVHLLHAGYTEEQRRTPPEERKSFLEWLRLGDSEGRVIVHAGGLSRRLPAYATLGKALLPLPPCRWHRGSQITRALLSTQVPLYRALITSAPANLRTMVACGDISVFAKGAVPSLAQFADTDVLCLGVRTDAHLLQNHGVFFMSRERPFDLEFMLQKPSLSEVRRCATEGDRSYLLDVGIWVLSDRAVEVLTRKCVGTALDAVAADGSAHDGHHHTVVRNPYDLYSDFGAALGFRCIRPDPEVSSLKASVLEIPDAEFLHYGTNRQLISSTQTLQACESPTPSWSWSAPFDGILTRERGDGAGSQADLAAEATVASVSANTLPTDLDFAAGDALPLLATPSSLIVHNAVVLAPLDGSAAAVTAPPGVPRRPVRHLWVESSWVGPRWTLRDGHILTGIPSNDWELDLPTDICISVVPVVRGSVAGADVAEKATPFAARPYHIDDAFRGDVRSEATIFMGASLHDWLSSRGLSVEDLYPAGMDKEAPLDIYQAALFPVCATADQLGDFLYVATLPVNAARDPSAVDAGRLAAGVAVWRNQPRVSAMNLLRMTDVSAMLLNSEYYERRMLTLTMALVASNPSDVADKLGWSPASTPMAKGRTSALPRGGSVLSAPMVSLLQQKFFLLDLDGVARRMVELGVGLPATSGLTDHAGAAASVVRASNGAVAVRGGAGEGTLEDEAEDPSGPFSWAHIFTNDAGLGGGGAKSPMCSVSPHLVAAHYHMFVRRVIELQLEALQRATATTKEAEKTQRLALLHASSEAGAKELIERHDSAAFAELRAAIMGSYPNERHWPRLGVHLDQIIWGRSPIRIDLAGGWTDTPPYTLLNGGSVINVAVELNGQPPVQVYVRVRSDNAIVVHSIDSGTRSVLTSYDDIRTYATMQNPFSIPKAALALCGFLPEFCTNEYASLQDQLAADFGGHGLEISLLVAIPTGSGLGTSSIVSGVVLRSLAEFCQLRWDEHTVCRRVLLVEQMLTAGGGWQDQYGGLFEGLKLVHSMPGLPAVPTVRWMPAGIFTDPRFASCHLLYYTGTTRMAKGILAEIVRDVFLNNRATLQLLREMGGPHTAAMYDKITTLDYKGYARLVNRTWEQKKRLDDGVCNPQVQAIVDVVEPHVWGLLLPGAGGGGYLYMCAKDEASARKIRQLLTENPPNPYARFVDMTVSTTGMQVSRS